MRQHKPEGRNGTKCDFAIWLPRYKKRPLVGLFLYLRARSNCEVSSAKTPMSEVKAKAFLSLCASISPKGEMERSVISQSGYPDTQKDPLWGAFVYYGARSNCEVCSAKTPMSEAKAKDTRRKRRVPFGIESCTPIKSYPAVRSGIPSPEPGLSGSTSIIYTR